MIWEVNLELGRPSADEALRRLEHELAAKRHLRAKAMKIIHGYGSSGKGGRIRHREPQIPARGAGAGADLRGAAGRAADDFRRGGAPPDGALPGAAGRLRPRAL